MSDYIKNYGNQSGGIIEIRALIPTKNNRALFGAFLTSFSDSMASNWNEEQVYGRQDPIGTFQSTTRKISLGFDMPAATIADAKYNFEQINLVRQFMYPAYSTAATEETTTNALSLAKSPLVRIKFANFLHNPVAQDPKDPKGLLGWIGSFTATPVIEMGMFSESRQEGVPMLYPKVYTVSIDFTPQHEFDLGYKKDGTPIDPEISLVFHTMEAFKS